VNEVVVDASVAARWFESSRVRGAPEAQALLADYELGALSVIVPPLLFFELLNVAGRRWGWTEAALLGLTTRLDALRLDVVDPDLSRVAVWTARGLTAYDAAYVALAEERAVPLVTDDQQMLAIAGAIARPMKAR